MKFRNQKNDIVSSAPSLAMTANMDASYVTRLAVKQYSKIVDSIVRELVSNARDASYMNNEKRYLVKLTQNEFVVKDWGSGMSEEFMTTRYSCIGDSTKRDEDNAIGAFGIGRLSPLNYSGYTIKTTFEGYTTTWYLVMDNTIEFKFLGKQVAEEGEVGTTIIIPIKRGDYYEFKQSVQNLLEHFENCILDIDGVVRTITENAFPQYACTDFNESHLNFLKEEIEPEDYTEFCKTIAQQCKFSYNSQGSDYVTLGPVKFKYDHYGYFLKNFILHLPLNSGVMPTPNREMLIYDTYTKALIKDLYGFLEEKLVKEYTNTLLNLKVMQQCKVLAEGYIQYHSDLFSSTISFHIKDEYAKKCLKVLDIPSNYLGVNRGYFSLKDLYISNYSGFSLKPNGTYINADARLTPAVYAYLGQTYGSNYYTFKVKTEESFVNNFHKSHKYCSAGVKSLGRTIYKLGLEQVLPSYVNLSDIIKDNKKEIESLKVKAPRVKKIYDKNSVFMLSIQYHKPKVLEFNHSKILKMPGKYIYNYDKIVDYMNVIAGYNSVKSLFYDFLYTKKSNVKLNQTQDFKKMINIFPEKVIDGNVDDNIKELFKNFVDFWFICNLKNFHIKINHYKNDSLLSMCDEEFYYKYCNITKIHSKLKHVAYSFDIKMAEDMLVVAKELKIEPRYATDLEYFKPYFVLQNSINTCLNNGDKDGLKLIFDLIKYQRRHSKAIDYKLMLEKADNAVNDILKDLDNLQTTTI